MSYRSAHLGSSLRVILLTGKDIEDLLMIRTSHSSDVSGKSGEWRSYECVSVGADYLLHHSDMVQVVNESAVVGSVVAQKAHREFSGSGKWSKEACKYQLVTK